MFLALIGNENLDVNYPFVLRQDKKGIQKEISDFFLNALLKYFPKRDVVGDVNKFHGAKLQGSGNKAFAQQ